MKKYVFYSPNKQKKKVEYDFCFVSKCIQGKIIEKYIGKTNLKQAAEYALENKIILVVALLQHLGDTPKGIIGVCREIGFENIVCCDVSLLSERVIVDLCYYRQQHKIYSSICSSIGKKGKGTSSNFTLAGRKKGAEANKQKSQKDPANKKAIPEIIRLRKLGMTGQEIADSLNDQGLRTPTGKLWIASSVLRLVERNQ
ncbi:hypothetical protein M2132_001045 [Dysgonomonas sp. PH5-45]|uniref:recombinase family protein n=1 Tax=unclassified Dysgonomonas TaxID=2630389 RepID=UPI00247406BA|nr:MULTISPECIES: recombinase family protein [unclassified Dysgonomonas]MDH6354716.1 hypothetical protein [Dysgonomonas sp. PH5-45]MDH6387615.1 hypothetical protein [Dysgonomonas sp. PH5-37]